MHKFKSLIVLAVSSLSAMAQPMANPETMEIAEGVSHHVNLFDASMKEGVSCYRIPSIVTAPNGDLVAAIDERVPHCGDLMYSKDINIVVKRSSDNGKTWTEMETAVDFPFGRSASDPSMIVDEDTKEIIMFYNYMDLDKEKNIFYLHYVKSSDNGKTWSEPVDITEQIAKPEWKKDFKFITSGRGFQTEDGTLIHTMVRPRVKNGLRVFKSEDHGASWELIDTPVGPANESKIIELSDGAWMINSRANGKGMRYVHISRDRGMTWESNPAPELIDPGCNGAIIAYPKKNWFDKKNRLIFSNAKSVKGRKNLAVRISYDDGKTWSEGKTIYEGGSAYSDLTVLENGEIGVFFEKDKYKENVFVSFSLEWLTDGEDK